MAIFRQDLILFKIKMKIRLEFLIINSFSSFADYMTMIDGSAWIENISALLEIYLIMKLSEFISTEDMQEDDMI